MEMTLRLPSTYVDIDRDEMEYIDGGWYIPRWVAAPSIDAIALLSPIGLVLSPIKFMGKQAAASLIKSYAPKLAGFVGWAATTALGMSINVTSGTILSLMDGNLSCLTSIGGVVSLVLEWSDGSLNERIG